MKQIALTRGMVALVDDADFEWLSRFKWHYAAAGYAAHRDGWKGKIILMHRLIMKTPIGMECDHIDGRGLYNLRSNLRNCTSSQNRMNRGPQINSKTKVKGVTQHPNGKYRVKIQVQRKQIHLGYFCTLEDASAAYNKAAKQYHGVFAKLNQEQIT